MKDALGSVQSVLVLGGASDIGLALVRRLAADRARTVALALRDPSNPAVGSVADELRAAGTKVELLAFDADDLDSHEAFVDDAFRRLGEVDAVVAAFGLLGHGAQFERERAVALVRTNFLGSVSVMLPVVERMKAQGHGTVVVLSSVAGERVRKSNFAYGASKAGLDGFSQGLGDALTGSGVDVMVVRPGFVRTKMTAGLDEAPFSTTPDAVADAIVAGLRSGKEMIWVPSILRWVMAVARHLPRPVFRRLNF
jgi:decaprenylphospho-beta-D-erythro-pentofuranosid-2-ulose 2-reductase